MALYIVPDFVREAINAAIDKALGGRPCDDESREVLYGQLLVYYDDHGMLPDFELQPK